MEPGMSLIGEQVAVVSLGVSCQTAARINSEVRLIRALAGDPSMRVTALPLDWVLAPIMSTTEMLKDLGAFPALEEITFRGSGTGKPWWRRMNCYYWHAFDFLDGGPDLVDENYEQVRAKFRSMADKASSLRDGRRVVCVVSNTQPNLDEVVDAVGTLSSFVSGAELRALRAQVSHTFGDEAELVFVTHPELHTGVHVPGVSIVERPWDASRYWTGSAHPWRDVFFEIFDQPGR